VRRFLALTLTAVFAIHTLAVFPPAGVASQNKLQNRNSPDKLPGAQEASLSENGAFSTSKLALPFKKLWQYLDDVMTLAPTIDEVHVYLPLTGGRVICLERTTGSRLWLSETGGMISAPVAVGERLVYVASRKFADDGSEAGATLRAIEKTTGLTLWARDYARPFTSSLVLSGNRIYVGNADGALYALSQENGEVIWKAPTQDTVRSSALVFESVIYFGSDDGALRGVEMEKGYEVFKFQTKSKIAAAPTVDEHGLYFGCGDGSLFALDRLTGKLKWQTRTGAAIETSPVLVGDKLLVASFDNFIYAIARTTGNKIWKRRLDNRLSAAPIIEGDAAMVAPHRGDHVAVFLHQDGRRVNFYRLDKEQELVAQPVFSDNLLLLLTDKGLVAAVATQPPETHTNALKKAKSR
jgi:outer membrane protein assembly factor BamB